MVSPASLPFASVETVHSFAAAGAFRRTHIGNWFHSFTEDTANYAARFCKYMQLCSFGDFHGPGKVRPVMKMRLLLGFPFPACA